MFQCPVSPALASLKRAATHPPGYDLHSQLFSKSPWTLQLFLPSSLSPISAQCSGKDLGSNSLLFPSLLHLRARLSPRNFRKSPSLSTSFAALQVSSTDGGGNFLPGRKTRSRPPSAAPSPVGLQQEWLQRKGMGAGEPED